MSDPTANRGSSASGAGDPGPGDPRLPSEETDLEDEVFEVLDVDDELAAMPADPGHAAGAGGPPGAEPAGTEAATSGQEEAELAAFSNDIYAGDLVALELSDTRRERDDYLDALRRLQADFENYKKRMAKHQADREARASEALVERLLPALDIADLAMAHGGGEEVKQVWSALIDALAGEGLERIAPDGGPFDPNRHDAVAHEPGDGGQEVAEVLRAGYAWKGRVVRPAMVKVRG